MNAARSAEWGARANSHTSKASETADAIARAIRVEHLPPGRLLGTKVQLAAQHGVALGTINEALRILQARGVAVLKSGPRGGVFVGPAPERADLSAWMIHAQANPDELRYLFQIQDALEVTTVLEAALGCDGPARVAIETAKDRLSRASAVPDILVANWDVDRAIARAGRNRYLADMYCMVVDRIEQVSTQLDLDAEVAARWRVTHLGLAEAVMAKDLTRAETLAYEHSPLAAVEEGRRPDSR